MHIIIKMINYLLYLYYISPPWTKSTAISFELFDLDILKSIHYVLLTNNYRRPFSIALKHFQALSFGLPSATFLLDPVNKVKISAEITSDIYLEIIYTYKLRNK